MSTRSRALLAATAAAVAMTVSACAGGGISGGGGDTNFVTGKNGIDTAAEGHRDAAPDLSGETLDGKSLDVADYKGKVVVLNFWGSWCGPCRAEARNLAKISEDYAGKGVQFVGVNTRDSSVTSGLAFEKEQKVPFPSLYDPTGKLMLRFKKGTLNPQLIPTTLVLDRHGKIAARALEGLTEENLLKMIKPVVAEK